MWVWYLTKPFFSHFVNVAFIVKYCNELVQLIVALCGIMDVSSGMGSRPVVFHVV